MFGKLFSDLNFLRGVVFPDECLFHVSENFNTQNTRVWGSEKSRKIQTPEEHSKKRCLVFYKHRRGLGISYVFNKTVWGNDFFKMLNTCVRLEAEIFRQNALFQ